MSDSLCIANIRTVRVGTRLTNWMFVQVDTEDGLTGCGEATVGGAGGSGTEAMLLASVGEQRKRLVGRTIDNIQALVGPTRVGVWPVGLPHQAAVSAIEQALWDIVGQAVGAPVARLLGGAVTPTIRAYVNINHGLPPGERGPDVYARRAVEIVSQGYTALKCAPFDDAARGPLEDRYVRQQVARGVQRVRAIREAIGPDVELMVDCHWHFDGRSACRVIRELGDLGLSWIEGPVPENDLDAWEEVRAGTTARLAGGEQLTSLDDFRRFLQRAKVDVLQADVKYAGGIGGVKAIGNLAEAFGVEFSPHNQSGPVQNLATLHAIAPMGNVRMMEFAPDEAEWRSALVGGAEVLQAGCLQVPTGSGLGFHLDPAVVAQHPPDAWSAGANPRPR